MIGLGLSLWQNTAALGGSGVASVTFSSAATDKYSGIALSNGNLTATFANDGTWECVRATRATTQTGAFEFEVNIDSAGQMGAGIENGLTDFSSFNVTPGSANVNGVTIEWGGSAWNILRGGGVSQGPFATAAPALNGKLTVRCDKLGGTIGFYRDGVQIGVNETGVAFTNWYAFIEGAHSASTLTINFAGSFAYGTDPAY